MRIAFAGTPEVAIPTLEALIANGHEVAFVITRPDAPAGRGRTITPSPVALAAQQHGLETFKTSQLLNVSHEVSDVDAVIVVAFGGLVPDELLTVPRYGWINVHFSLLPHWRGAAPVQHAIMAGDDVTGVTTFRIDSGLDTGEVLGQVTTIIHKNETSGELLERLGHEGASLLVATLAGIETGAIVPMAQAEHDVTLAPKLSKAQAQIDWSLPALAIERRIRAMTPHPGAWTMCNDERLKIFPVTLDHVAIYLEPGVIQIYEDDVIVGTGSHALTLGQVQQAGRNAITARQWASNNKDAVFK